MDSSNKESHDGEQDASMDLVHEQFARTSRNLMIGRRDAEIEVLLEMIIRTEKSNDKALLYILSTTILAEPKTLLVVNNLISLGADVSTSDIEGKTPLHYAAKRNFIDVAAKLLRNDAITSARDNEDKLPLHFAMFNDKNEFSDEKDEMCALLLDYMPKAEVRNLFIANGQNDAEFSITVLLTSKLQKTLLSVLDCMIENRGCKDSIRVYYNILDADDKGRPPNDPQFNPDSKSPQQIISKEGRKNIVYHNAVRLLTERKWKAYAFKNFRINAILYLLSLAALTYSAVVAVGTPDPSSYSGDACQVIRAICELFSLLMVSYAFIMEIIQLKRHRCGYFREVFNYIDISSAVLLLTVVILRFFHNHAQWHVFSFGYPMWVIRIFKYSVISRKTGAYPKILYRVLVHDFIQFMMLFLVILLAFSGAFFLSLRGDRDINTHEETSTYWKILFVGVRTLAEAQPVVEYAGEDGYRNVSKLFMVVFVFACSVILLNILIAQLSDTYQKEQRDARRGMEVHRAWIVARVELNSCHWWCRKNHRKSNYIEYENIDDLKSVLVKWDSSTVNKRNKNASDISDSIDNRLLTGQHRMARLENTLKEIKDSQTDLKEMLASHISFRTMFDNSNHRSSDEMERHEAPVTRQGNSAEDFEAKNDNTIDINTLVLMLNEDCKRTVHHFSKC